MDFNCVTAEQREALYNEVWTDPVITVAKRYGLSDNGLRKHLKKLGIPMPPAGYWARIASGQKITRPTLPKVTGELRKYIRHYVIKYKPNFAELSDIDLQSDEELSLLTDETKNFIREKCSNIKVLKQLRDPHEIIINHEKELLRRKDQEKMVRDSERIGHYLNIHYYHSFENKNMGINVSSISIKRAYRIFNTMIRVLEDMEVSFYSTSFNVMEIPFAFQLSEIIKKHSQGQSATLLLSINPNNWQMDKYVKKMEYKDLVDMPLEEQLGKIINDIFVTANRFKCSEILDERKYKREKEERIRQERLEKMRQGELEDVKLLEQAASDWDKAEKIRRFANVVEGKIADISNIEEKEKLTLWLEWARNKADWLDPLLAKEDELLGKNKTLIENILEADINK